MKTEISKNSEIPIYVQLKRWLLEQMDQGLLKPGDRIPTEQELCERFDISRGPVRQALKNLIYDGRIYVVRGQGTFIAEFPLEKWYLVTSASWFEALTRQGIDFETSVLEVSTKRSNTKIATNLQIEPGTPVVLIKRLRSIEDKPWMLFTSYIPEKLVPGLTNANLHNRSLYEVLEEVCDLRIVNVERAMFVGIANSKEAVLLNIPQKSPVQRFEDWACNDKGKLAEYSQTVFRGDRSRLRLRLTRAPLRNAPQ
jgi:GntR family transcriptional regulator